MKKGQVYDGVVERVDFPNKGVVQTGEGAVIVKNSLPGQKIKLSVNKVRKGKAEGRLLEVTEQSPLETGSPCSQFGVCGGCTYLSLPYEEQLRIKEEQVKRLLDAALAGQKQSWRWEGIKGSPRAYEYRNKMEFSFGDEYKDGPLALGMHKRGSFYDVVGVEDCKIVDTDYRMILKVVRNYFAEHDVCFFHRLRHEGYLRHLLVRKASKTGEILVALVTTSQSPWNNGNDISHGETNLYQHDKPGLQVDRQCADIGKELLQIAEDVEQSVEQYMEQCSGDLFNEHSARYLNRHSEESLIVGFKEILLSLEREGKLQGKLAGILHIVNDSQADVVKSDRTDVLYGQEYFYEELLGLRFKISTFSFFQTNSYSAEVLYETAREYIGDLGGVGPGDKPEKTVFDLYSGTGTIAQLMAPTAGKVVGVEIVEEAVEAARRNAKENGLTNCEFIAGDVLKVLDELEDKPDLIILDPPRDGIHPKALPKIIGYNVERIVYISCKPTSLARDLEVFLENGYVVEKAVAVDQFPWTANVETVVLLGREFSEDIEYAYLDYEPKETMQIQAGATYSEIKEWIRVQYGLKVSSLYVAQIKEKCGIKGYEAYNHGKGEHHVPNCPPEKEEAIRAAFKHFKMI